MKEKDKLNKKIYLVVEKTIEFIFIVFITVISYFMTK